MSLTNIANRLTPSVPLEITFGAQPVATGVKFTTIFAHLAASGASAVPYSVYTVVNVGDPVAAQTEVNAIAGANSEAGQLAYAFVAANALAGGTNFPAFRICFLANSDTGFGSSSQALNAVKFLRSDMFVSCYPASNTANLTALLGLCSTISGIDRDLSGQFGSFVTVGSLDALATAEAYAINSRQCIVAYLQDTNTALVTQNGVLTASSNVITGLSSTAGINLGAQISGTGVPAGAVVGAVTASTVSMVDSSGNPLPASASESSEAIGFQNVVSQSAAVVAAAHAAVMMASAFPYNPLNGVAIGGLSAPNQVSDWIDLNPNGASEAALRAGLSPLRVLPGGSIGFIRTRTTYNLLPDGVTAVTAYFDWQELVVLNDFREDCYQITQNPPFNNNPGGAKASQNLANLLKDEILREALVYENEGAFQGVKALASEFQVAPSTTSRGRFDFVIPVNVIPGLMVIAGNIQAVTTDSFTL